MTYILFVIPGFLLGLAAQFWVRSAFRRWSEVPTEHGLSGAEVAYEIMRNAGIHEVGIEQLNRNGGDHYDPTSKTLRLSEQNFHGRSVTAAAIAAHEAGHAVQDATGYAPLALRSMAVPAASIGSNLAMPLLLIGMIFRMPMLLWVGIIAFSLIVLFQLITLPVEFDASSRAKKLLYENGLLRDSEAGKGTREILTAAAMTYVAATVQSVGTLLYYLSVANGRSND